ncbi:hypothetical protein AQUCO_09300054v1 [Aquilegia coerulea]|uniref:Uncharacterized protein n=1 Tax=Aquilegia coerulea TaxID=218851 RepID=A0A2G5C5B8_AQUCA|nr:hypothetical protein AQUCO_09300054v1 [Aquilegia coerulea]
MQVFYLGLHAQAAVARISPFWHHITDRLASFGPNNLRYSPSCSQGGYLVPWKCAVLIAFITKEHWMDVFNNIIRQVCRLHLHSVTVEHAK